MRNAKPNTYGASGPSPANLPTLTALRWYAALVVFGYHLNLNLDWLPLRVFGFGQSGVAFFFVLSGFVLAWSHRPGTPAGRFYRRRFARVYPSHFVMFLLVATLVALWREAPFTGGSAAAVANFSLTQSWFASVDVLYAFNSPSWTLSDEAFFYLVFPFFIIWMTRLNQRALFWVSISMACAGVLVTLALSLTLDGGGSLAFTNPLVRLPQFLIGVALALLVRQEQSMWKSLGFPVLLLVLGVPAALLMPLFPLQDYVLLPAIVALIVVSATRDISGVKSWLNRRVSVYLGEISFCFYLVHDAIIRIAFESWWPTSEWNLASGIFPVLVTISLSLLGAVALHHTVERPLQRLLGGKRRVPMSSNGLSTAQKSDYLPRTLREDQAGASRLVEAADDEPDESHPSRV